MFSHLSALPERVNKDWRAFMEGYIEYPPVHTSILSSWWICFHVIRLSLVQLRWSLPAHIYSVLLVLWGCLEDSAVSLLLLASGSTLGIWCSFIAASSLTVLCCQNINQPSHFSFPSFLPPSSHRPCAERASGVFSWHVASHRVNMWRISPLLSLFSFDQCSLLCPWGNTVLGAERRKSVRPSTKQLVINRKKLWFKGNKTLKGFFTWFRHVLLVESQVSKRLCSKISQYALIWMKWM